MRATKLLPVFLCIFGAATYGAVTACGSSDFEGQDGDASVINGNGCDGTQTPAQNECVVDEAFGVFVSASASPAGAVGTRANPFTTIQAGVESAKTQKKRVYVCLGTYVEQVTLADGVSIFGNLDCTQNWTAVTQHAKVQSPSSPAVTANQIQSATRFDSVDVTAPNGSAASKNSIGFVVTSSPGLTIANATIVSANGFDGVDGAEGVQLAASGAATGGGGGTGGERSPQFLQSSVPSCPGYTGVPSPRCPPNGGGGGNASCVAPPDAGIDASDFQPGPGGGGGQGAECVMEDTCTKSLGMVMFTAACCVGSPDNGGAQPANTSTALGGVNPNTASTIGATPLPGANGKNGVAIWNGTSFVVGDGSPGKNGVPGQGGGGGAGGNPFFVDNGAHLAAGDTGQGPGGAGGGAGGCPGLAGGFGTGGGASIAVVTDSAITLDTCIVKSGNGGKAGRGTLGSNPTVGGGGGGSPNTAASAAGSGGGAGSDSGWSGNGSAGPSYGIASHGAAPILKNTTPQPGAGGAGVPVQTSGAKTIVATPAGASAATVTF